MDISKPIVFVGCGVTKMKKPCKAKYMYVGNYVQTCLAYGQTFTCQENIFILSANYGVVALEDKIEPYNKTLNKMSNEEKEQWKNKVISQCNYLGISSNTQIIFICGKNYHQLLSGYFNNITLPLPEKRILIQQNFMNGQIREYNKTHNPKIKKFILK